MIKKRVCNKVTLTASCHRHFLLSPGWETNSRLPVINKNCRCLSPVMWRLEQIHRCLQWKPILKPWLMTSTLRSLFIWMVLPFPRPSPVIKHHNWWSHLEIGSRLKRTTNCSSICLKITIIILLENYVLLQIFAARWAVTSDISCETEAKE